MTCGPAANAWARPIVFTGKCARLATAIAAALPYGTTLNVRPTGSVAIYHAQGVLRHGQRFSKE